MSLYRELQRRNVIRVGAAYLALSWLLIQIVDTIGPDFGLPEGSVRLATIILAIAFLPVMIFTWSFELTAEGIKRDTEIDRDSASNIRAAKRLDRLVIVFLVLAVGYFAFDKFVLAPVREAGIAEEAREEGWLEGLVGSFDVPSIAVLPFDDMSPGGDHAWFADGISEELLNLLARVKGMRVISRASSFAFRGQGLGVPEIAERLNVRYVLEGSVRKAGDAIRVTAQLIEAGADVHVWSETYDRDFENVFAIQDEISAKVVDELKITILGELPLAHTTSEEAYELYLEGLPLLAQRGEENLARAEEIFQRVIALDPDYAPARASYASALFWMSRPDEEVVTAARAVLDIDPRNADALAILGRKLSDMHRTYEAEAYLKQAIEINENLSYAWRWLGTMAYGRNPAAYQRYVQKAFELHPTDPTIRFHTGYSFALLGRYAEAKREYRALAESGQEVLAISMVVETDLMAGRLDKALKTQYVMFRDSGQIGTTVRTLIWLGEYDLARQWMLRRRQNEDEKFGVMIDEIFVTFFESGPEQALQLVSDVKERGGFRTGDLLYAYLLIILGGDPDIAKQEFERALTQPGEARPVFDRNNWDDYLIYAVALHRSGEVTRAEELFADVEEVVTAQIADGVVIGPNQRRLHDVLAMIYAIRGDADRAISALREGMKWSVLIVPRLKHDLSYEPLRGLPAFKRLVEDVESQADEQRQRLAAEGMLLTPDEVLALDQFNYDPFAP